MERMGKKETRRQARLERKAAEANQRRRARRTRSGLFVAVAAVILLGIGWLVWQGLRPEASISGPSRPGQPPGPEVVDFPDQGRDHIVPGQPHPPYNSNPPTSGWHFPSPAPWGFYNDELADELLVHNLEHGGIWISFKDTTDTEVVDALVALARQFRTKVIITHRPGNDSRIAVAAWTKLMKLDRFDRRVIINFINRYKNKGPEFVPD